MNSLHSAYDINSQLCWVLDLQVAGRATKPKVITVAGGANQKPKKRA
jgi:hypothetical protein